MLIDLFFNAETLVRTSGMFKFIKKKNKQKHITRANHTSDKNIFFRPACQRVKPIKKASFHLLYQPQPGGNKPVLFTSQTSGAIT